MLVAETSLYFADDASISIDDGSALEQGVAVTVATGASPVVGTVVPGDDIANPAWRLNVALADNAVSLVRDSEYAISQDEFPVFVPAGRTYTWAKATEGLETSAAAGKKLVKLGRGDFYDTNGEVSAAGCTELVVANGIYSANSQAGLPVDGTVMKVTVEAGATFRAMTSLNALTDASHSFDFHLAGEGHRAGGLDLGAFCFGADSGPANQWCRWTFTGDTLITLAAQCANFSTDSLMRNDNWNLWYMNGHRLTLRCISDSDPKGVFRFRSGPTIYNPGIITLDNACFSQYADSKMKTVDGLIPEFRTVNGAMINFANGNPNGGHLDQCVDCFDFGPGTLIDAITPYYPQYSPDPAGDTVIGKMIGSVTVSSAQKLTIRSSWTVRKADLLASPPSILEAEAGLAFERGCTVDADDVEGLNLRDGVMIAKCPTGMLSGCPKRLKDAPIAPAVEQDAEYDYVKLWSKRGMTVFVR
ncbi:MAG: hypothetical protein ACI4Q3_04455 [Kiritimatiellia bacterium]